MNFEIPKELKNFLRKAIYSFNNGQNYPFISASICPISTTTIAVYYHEYYNSILTRNTNVLTRLILSTCMFFFNTEGHSQAYCLRKPP